MTALDFYVALEHREVDERLSHWGAYWRSRGHADQAASMEGNYRSPQREHWDDVTGTAPPMTVGYDPAVAIAVEQTMREWAEAHQESAVHRYALQLWYVRRASPDFIRRRLHVRLWNLPAILYDARSLFLLRSQKKTFTIRFDNLTADRKIVDAARTGGRTVCAEAA